MSHCACRQPVAASRKFVNQDQVGVPVGRGIVDRQRDRGSCHRGVRGEAGLAAVESVVVLVKATEVMTGRE